MQAPSAICVSESKWFAVFYKDNLNTCKAIAWYYEYIFYYEL